MEKIFIIKIGGNVIDSDKALEKFLIDFSAIPYKKILIHGGGKIASRLGEQLGIEAKYVEGRRITDDITLDLVTMVYGGLINKKMVAVLQALSCNAIGLTGADGNIIPADKRPVKVIDYGWAGDVQEDNINADLAGLFLNAGLTPVVAPLTHDGKGHMLNTNADTIASYLAVALSRLFEVHLVYCFEKSGVLEDVSDDNSVIKNMNRVDFESLKTLGKLHSGMVPKIENALRAVDKGVRRVIIGHAEDLLLNILPETKGTTIA